jgi:hypothetical protein
MEEDRLFSIEAREFKYFLGDLEVILVNRKLMLKKEELK